MDLNDLTYLGTLAKGEKVYDRHNSHLHLEVGLLREALALINLKGEKFAIKNVRFERTIGTSNSVKTQWDDEILFAQRPNRAGLTRFVKYRKPEPCSEVTVILKKVGQNMYVTITAWIGGLAEPEPWDKKATTESIPFWNSHALIWGTEEIIQGTETTVCPW